MQVLVFILFLIASALAVTTLTVLVKLVLWNARTWGDWYEGFRASRDSSVLLSTTTQPVTETQAIDEEKTVLLRVVS